MSFSKAKTKRFNEVSSCAPPPGFYNPKLQEKIKGALIDKELKRFQEQNASSVSLDVSCMSNISSYGSLESLTPRKALFGSSVATSHESGKARKPSGTGSSAEATKIREQEMEMKILVRDRNDWEQKVRHKEEEMVKLDGKLQQVHKDKLSLEANIATLKKDLACLKKTNDHLKQNLQDEIKKALADAKRPLTEEHNQLKQKHQEEKTQWQKSLDSLEKNATKHSQNYQSLEKTNATLIKEMDTLKDKLKEMSLVKLENEEFIRHLKGEVFAFSDEAATENINLKKTQEDVSSLLCQIRHLQQTEELLNDNIKNMTTKYGDLENNLFALEKESQDREDQLIRDQTALKQSFEESRQRCEELQLANAELAQTISTEKESHQSLEKHARELEKSRGDVTAQLQAAQTTVQAALQQNTQIQSELQSLSWDKGLLEGQLAESTEKYELLVREKDSIHNHYEEQMKDVRGQVVILRDAVDNKQIELNEMVSFKAHLQKTVEQLQNEILFVKEQNRTREFLLQEQEKENCRELERAQNAEKQAVLNYGVLVKQQKQWDHERVQLTQMLKEKDDHEQHYIHELREKLRLSALTTAETKQHCAALERRLAEKDEEIGELKVAAESSSNENIWKEKFEELHQKVLPFQVQLEAFAAERQALLGISQGAQQEVDKLSRDYAKLLGHQNQKQKIHHILKLKEENNSLKMEVAKLREQMSRHKRQMGKLDDQLKAADGRKRFEGHKAFQHSKENKVPASPLKEGNRR